MKAKSKGALLFLVVLMACQPVSEEVSSLTHSGLAAAQADLTPTSKGERLTPTSKGERSGIVRGQLLQAGQPVPGGMVRIENSALLAQSDEQGFFEIAGAPLEKTVYLLATSHDESGTAFAVRSPQTIPSSGLLNVTALNLSATGSLSGQVRLPVSAELSDLSGIDVYIPGTSFIAKTDAQGTFALPNLPEGTYTLQASTMGFRSVGQEVPVTAGSISFAPEILLQEHSTLSSSQGWVTGQVLSQGLPVVGAILSLSDTALNPRGLAISDAQGRFRLPVSVNVVENLQLLVWREGYQPLVQDLEVAAEKTLEVSLSLQSTLLQPGRLRIQVVDCQQKAISSALIQLLPSPLQPQVSFTDNRGQATVGALLPGDYLVTVAKGLLRQSQSVYIDNAQIGSDGQPGAVAQLALQLGDCSVNSP